MLHDEEMVAGQQHNYLTASSCQLKHCTFETHVEAHCEADTALGFVLHTFGTLEPVVAIVVGIDEGHAGLLGKMNILIFTQLVLFNWMDIRVVEKDREIDTGGTHRLHGFTGTRRIAGAIIPCCDNLARAKGRA